ncbi:MAG: c-type cytochrome [Proteobacteria bacterium]|nr:c-type cytochrome [Pseudomonadota bacterium]
MKLVFPLPDPARGKHVFVNKGCVICHSVNNVGGKAAPPLDTVPGNRTIEPYKFIGRMWRGATAMIQLQNMELGYRIDFTGEEIGHVIGFLSSAAEQKSFTAQDIPDLIREIIINEANQWMKKQGEAEK